MVLQIIMLVFLIILSGLFLWFYLNTSIEIEKMKNNQTDSELRFSQFIETAGKEKVVQQEKFEKLDKSLATFCTSCPTDWRFIGSSCYFFSTSEKKWEEARDDCITHNSRLLIFNDKQEVDDLLPYYKSARYWIGLRKDNKEWKWLDGTALGYKNWASGEPNNEGDHENCAEIRATFWNDVSCDYAVLYICEAACR
uniref:C-type lectin domain-containing protein n=1 Tax=Leptobrachium leishanense TaxID=445787 RepID=A0A8C5WHJ3_9ANUR